MSQQSDKKYIWLFGENYGQSHNNNSFYMWQKITEMQDNIEKYFVLEKTSDNLEFVGSLDADRQRLVVWKNSFRHLYLFGRADMYFVTLSLDDIRPKKIGSKAIKLPITKPLIYLQHGTLGIKQLEMQGNAYNNNLLRFFLYNPTIRSQFMQMNNFQDYQLYLAPCHPRYVQTAKNILKYKSQACQQKNILWFLTWREYLGDNEQTKKLADDIISVLKDKRLCDYLKRTNTKLTLCMHLFYKDTFKDSLDKTDSENISLVYAGRCNLTKMIGESDLLITDYSSLGFDFTTFGKPVLLYQPDLREYLQGRKLYCILEDLESHSVKDKDKLIDIIISEKRSLNDFFVSRLPARSSVEDIASGNGIDKIYDYMNNLQNRNCFVVIKSWADNEDKSKLFEKLSDLAKSRPVRCVVLEKSGKKCILPQGVGLYVVADYTANRRKERLSRLIHPTQKGEDFERLMLKKYLSGQCYDVLYAEDDFAAQMISKAGISDYSLL